MLCRRLLALTLLCAPQGRVLYASTPLEVDTLCRRLLALCVPAAGFDIEWRVTFRAGETSRRTAVIQLCYQAGARGDPGLLPGRRPL